MPTYLGISGRRAVGLVKHWSIHKGTLTFTLASGRKPTNRRNFIKKKWQKYKIDKGIQHHMAYARQHADDK